jgi:ureidoglycolate hydrolase
MDNEQLEIKQYTGEGYQPLIDFGAWRVAMLRWEQGSLPENIETMERHTQTDEVFILLEGQATLILGGRRGSVGGIFPQMMEKGLLYNVKQDTWHTLLLSSNASILIVENRDTGVDNTEYCELTQSQKSAIIALG